MNKTGNMINSTDKAAQSVVGRFAPSPTGRMHLGNVFTAVLSWLSAKKSGGKWILRIEDLDPQRSKYEYVCQLEDDLQWLGLTFDEGGKDDLGNNGPYSQSRRSEIYARYLELLKDNGLTYPCVCTRADILATQAPHQSDGRVIYGGTCRPANFPSNIRVTEPDTPHATRLFVPDEEIVFDDLIFGRQRCNLADECGDFVLRRADGAWAYQLAVVVDDALMGVTEVVRGADLLLSTAQQLYLYRLLGFDVPKYIHVPLICNERLQRLSKRDNALSLSEMRRVMTAPDIIGTVAYLANLIPENAPCSLDELLRIFDWNLIPRQDSIIATTVR